MQEIQDKFVIKVKELPENIDSSSYSKIFIYFFNLSEIINSINDIFDMLKIDIKIKFNNY